MPGGTFRTFSVYEMPFDSDDRERKGLFTRRFYRTVAPWTTENPIFMHLTSSNPETVRRAVDQCAETGYEMIILSFGSGADAEDISGENIAKFKSLVDYARGKGIELGCYSLLASRWISDEVDVINPRTGRRGGMTFGSSPCLCSDWGYEYFRKIKTFFEQTGMMCFEHDGSYPGDVCASTRHAHHKGLDDSQWNQYYKLTELYRWMRAKGIYLNVPDFYFLSGSSKTSIGYREVNWALPRDRQLIHTRQLNYDCTWERLPSSLWSFVPLVEYHGGGAAATLEPLHEHLDEYKTLMFQNYGAGIQACYRGPRLYDSPEVKAAVTEIIAWYKRYRRILNSDIIHLRKPDARDWDGIMHVDPAGKEKALALFFNPTSEPMARTIGPGDVPRPGGCSRVLRARCRPEGHPSARDSGQWLYVVWSGGVAGWKIWFTPPSCSSSTTVRPIRAAWWRACCRIRNLPKAVCSSTPMPRATRQPVLPWTRCAGMSVR